jgi:hypothetical protein
MGDPQGRRYTAGLKYHTVKHFVMKCFAVGLKENDSGTLS